MNLLSNKDGPTLKKVHFCDDCKFLSNATISIKSGRYPYKCYHDDIIKKGLTSVEIMTGNIGHDKITPLFCPYLLKELRKEKLKALERPKCPVCGLTLYIFEGCYVCENCAYMRDA